MVRKYRVNQSDCPGFKWPVTNNGKNKQFENIIVQAKSLFAFFINFLPD